MNIKNGQKLNKQLNINLKGEMQGTLHQGQGTLCLEQSTEYIESVQKQEKPISEYIQLNITQLQNNTDEQKETDL